MKLNRENKYIIVLYLLYLRYFDFRFCACICLNAFLFILFVLFYYSVKLYFTNKLEFDLVVVVGVAFNECIPPLSCVSTTNTFFLNV